VVILSISVGANKFLGLRRIFARILPNLPEKLQKKKKVISKRKAQHVVFGAIFFKSKQIGRYFAQSFWDL